MRPIQNIIDIVRKRGGVCLGAGIDGAVLQLDRLLIIVSNGKGWDHASVSLENRTPTWEEMETVRRIAFHDDECVIQYSVPRSEHINCHPYCLHMWRPQGVEFPRPPSYLVGPSGSSCP